MIYIHISSKLADRNQKQPKGSFSIATTPRCKGGRYSFHWIVLLTFDPYFIMQGGIKYHFLSLWYDSTWD